jgi:large subunit ribosomal protein L23
MAAAETAGAPGYVLEPHQVILMPLVSEKNTHLMERRNTYTFKVHRSATKEQIKSAIETLFEVRVDVVRTLNRPGKEKRFKFRKGFTPGYKRAYVTLHGDDRITLF